MKNYIRLEKTILGRKYVFVDTVEKLYKRVFASSGIKARGIEEYIKQGSDIRLVRCIIRRKEIEQFERLVLEIRNKALLLGNKEYDGACEMLCKMESGEIHG